MSTCSFPFSQHNVGHIPTLCCQNGGFLEADVPFGAPITKRDEADQ